LSNAFAKSKKITSTLIPSLILHDFTSSMECSIHGTKKYIIPCPLPAANGVVRCATGMPQRVGACSEHAVLAAGA